MQLTSQNLQLAHVGVDHVVKLWQAKQPMLYNKMAAPINSRQAYERFLQDAGAPTATIINEGALLPVVEFTSPFVKDFYPKKRALINYRSTETSEADVLGIFGDTPSKLARGVEIARELEAASFINLATSTAATDASPDGLPLASAAHPLATGVWSNILPSNPALSIAALETARSMLLMQPDHQGNPMMFTGPYVLYVHPDLVSLAERLTQSPYQPNNGTTTSQPNDVNVVGKMIEVVANPYFTSSIAWALRCKLETDHGLRFINRRNTTTRVWNDETRDAVGVSVTSIFCKAIQNWRGFVYSNGTGS